VTIHPVTSVTTEWYDKVIVRGIPLVAGNPHTDDTGGKPLRTLKADSSSAGGALFEIRDAPEAFKAAVEAGEMTGFNANNMRAHDG
jgi:hypothetical protein